jgi:hypothetical protein
MMRRLIAFAIACGLAIAAAQPTLARDNKVGGQGAPAGNMNSNGTNAIDRDTGLNRAQDRNQVQSPNRNSNGANATDRDKCLDRAGDRNK